MFGNNKPFDGTNSFQSTSFGTASLFGQNTSAFGAAEPFGSGFGNAPFGSALPNTFGTNTATTFGQSSISSTGFPVSSFSATPNSGSLFNTTQNATGSSLFQYPSSSTFGAPKFTFGSFGGTNTSNLFGQTQQPSSSLFKASSTASTGLFSSNTGAFTTAFGGSATGTNGTTIKFNPLNGTDTMIKNGENSTVRTRHQCITAMIDYETKSLEELRMEDYLSNRKGPQQGTLGSFGAAQPSLSGSSATPTTGLFQNQNKPLFGGTNTFGATANTASIFQSPSGSAFGAPKFNFGSFGGTNTSNQFGQTQQPSSASLFNASRTASSGLVSSNTGAFTITIGGSATGTNGTTIKFNPVNETDTMIKNGVNSTISIRHQCITVMIDYETKSLEKLRMEDYLSNRKGLQQGTLGSFGAAQPSLFGSTVTPTTELFQNQNKLSFGGTNTFGATANTSAVLPSTEHTPEFRSTAEFCNRNNFSANDIIADLNVRSKKQGGTTTTARKKIFPRRFRSMRKRR